MRIPILSEYEEEKTVLNLEQRPQMTTKVFTKSFDARSVQKILMSIYSDTLNLKPNTQGSLAYIYAMIRNPFLFDNIAKQFTLLNYKIAVSFNMVNFLYKYPAKYNVNSFYSSGKTVKHSFIMQRSLSFFNNFDTNFK
jgi:NADH dehydrogenase/NADH:ubiquinone oxidoreductase subunit G